MRLEAELAEVRNRIAANDCALRRPVAERRARRNETTSSRDDVFVCRCGEVIADPFDPEQMRIHGPHFVAASLERTREGLMRWRAHCARQHRNE